MNDTVQPVPPDAAAFSAEATGDDIRQVPEAECDVVMKGGITSGVIYPYALYRIARDYRIRNVGGASAGAIGAVAGAAAELGRASGGYERLLAVPQDLSEGRLAELFVPQDETKPLLRLLLAANGAHRAGPKPKGMRQALAVGAALLRGFPYASGLGVLPGVALVVVGVAASSVAGWLLVASGVLLSLVGLAVALTLRLVRKLTVSVPDNMFGICSGNPGFTVWLCDTIDAIVGQDLDGPLLTFGQLWKGDGPPAPDGERQIDLRMITTCISEGRPYELPWEATQFFFDPAEWRKLFPERVVAALEGAPQPVAVRERDTRRWRWEEGCTALVDDGAVEPSPTRLCRLPDAEHLPVIVATRLSLSFPLLISAVPLYAVDWQHPTTRRSIDRYDADVSTEGDPEPGELVFSRLWFSDGGFCSNFPVHFFDAALPARPTFAINLGRVPESPPGTARHEELAGYELAHNNDPIKPLRDKIPRRGVGAVIGFGSGAFNTARNWQDSSHLGHPGYRDRIVRVLQTKEEGGINLHMESSTITALGDKGRDAADALVRQFTEPRYRLTSDAPATGWENHRWVRYRALLAVLPDWIESYARGNTVFDIDASQPPSYPFNAKERALAERMSEVLGDLGEIVEAADEPTVDGLKASPYPTGTLRRIPRT